MFSFGVLFCIQVHSRAPAEHFAAFIIRRRIAIACQHIILFPHNACFFIHFLRHVNILFCCAFCIVRIRIGLLEKPFADPEKAKRLVGCAAHRETAARLAENSVSLLKNTDLPLKPSEKIFVVCVEPQKLAAAEDSEQCVDMLYKAVRKRFSHAEGTVAALSPTDEEIRSITERAKAFDTVVIGTCNAILYEKQAELANSLLGLKKKVIVAAMDSPYDIEVVKNVKNYICTYGVAAASAKVCADILSDGAQKIIVPPVTINL